MGDRPVAVREAWKAIFDDSSSEEVDPISDPAGASSASKRVDTKHTLEALRTVRSPFSCPAPTSTLQNSALTIGTSSSSAREGSFARNGESEPRHKGTRTKCGALGFLEPNSESDTEAAALEHRSCPAAVCAVSGGGPDPATGAQQEAADSSSVERPSAKIQPVGGPSHRCNSEDVSNDLDDEAASRHVVACGMRIRTLGQVCLASFPGPDDGLAARWSQGPLPIPRGGQLPESIAACLREYQREGVCWLYNKLFVECQGCLLTDEMGLGKTVQVACCLAAALYSKQTGVTASPAVAEAAGPPGPVLILCPPSLVQNWARELRRWGPFAVEVLAPSVAGAGSSAAGTSSRLRALQRVEAGIADVVVASRGLLIRPEGVESVSEGGAATDVLLSRRWGCVVIDEVHQAKNPRGQLHKAIVALKSSRKLGLTGTPLQNSLSDVWSLLRAVGAEEGWDLGAFESHFSRPIALGQKRKASAKDLAVREDALKEFHELLARSCLRRTKDGVALMLPGKNDRVVPCPLSTVQRAAYQNLLASADFQLALGKRQLCVCGAGRPCLCGTGPVWRYVHQRQAEQKGLEDEWAAADSCVCRGRSSPKCITLSLIVILQRLTNHLELLKPDTDNPKDADRNHYVMMRDLCDMAFAGIDHNLCSQRRVANRLQLGDPEACGKMQVLLPLLRHWRRREQKVLIFSRSTKLLDILEACFWQQGMSPQVLRLDGTTATGHRQRLVDEFNTSPTRAIFLISTRAGGVGLNLTSASVVVIFDPDWNPFSDLQAQDRSFRIGQTRVVEVYRLLGAGTIEEQVYVRQVWKQSLAAAAIDGTRSKRRLEDHSSGLKSLFELHESSMLPHLMSEAFTKSGSGSSAQQKEVEAKSLTPEVPEVFHDLRSTLPVEASEATRPSVWQPCLDSDGEDEGANDADREQEHEQAVEGKLQESGRPEEGSSQALAELHAMFDQVDHSKVVRNDTQENMFLMDLLEQDAL
ncbi:unnamed protein product [Polarella glacialis]|uniref:Uncharacterized protein n=1 Tax=Polarella glacialis TaxID=89957 RepID=A0A813F4S7_POLGL|nr:unnamed protein product [Polarella glacialis]CAE8721756.1 unnamed protein product [Polarella glacialis]